MESLSICLVSIDFPPDIVGGQGVYVYEIAKRLSKKGHNIMVISPSQDLTESFELYSVKKTGNPLYFSFLAAREFRKNINDNIDIFHGNSINHLFSCIKKPINISKIITTPHNTMLQKFHAKNLWWKAIYIPMINLEKIVCNRSDRIIAVSNTTNESLLKYGILESKIDLIYNGVDVKKFNPKVGKGFLRSKLGLTKSDQKIILFVGRLVERKKSHILLKACKQLIEMDMNIHLVFVGRGNYEEKLKTLVAEYRISRNVHFLGFVPDEDLPKIYSDSDIFVLPSIGEGLPLTLLEAAASSLTLIATEDATGKTPIIKDGVNGYIIEPHNVSDLINKIQMGLQDHERMGKESRKIALRYFKWETCLNRTIQSYKSILSENS